MEWLVLAEDYREQWLVLAEDYSGECLVLAEDYSVLWLVLAEDKMGRQSVLFCIPVHDKPGLSPP